MPACGILGQIGLSGRTEFPHLHLTSRKDQKVIDTFHPKDGTNCTTSDQITLWKDPLHYRAGGLLPVSFSDATPAYATIKAGTATGHQLTHGSNALVLWVYGFGLRAEDFLCFEIKGPEGTIFVMTPQCQSPSTNDAYGRIKEKTEPVA